MNNNKFQEGFYKRPVCFIMFLEMRWTLSGFTIGKIEYPV